MQSHELLREVFKTASAKQVAAETGLSLSMIYKWAEPPDTGTGSGTDNPLDRIEALWKSTEDPRLLQWICERGGGFFIKNPKANWPHPFQVIPATNQIVQDFADMLGVIAEAAGRFDSFFNGRKFPSSQQCTKPSVTVFNSSQRARMTFASCALMWLSPAASAMTPSMSAKSWTIWLVAGIT